MTEKIRTFIAIDIPDELLDSVAEEVEPLRARWALARWAPPANQHVTLKFLGATPTDLIPQIADVITAIAVEHDPAELSLTQLGSFPSKSRMRVLWVGLDDPAGLLAGVAGRLSERLAPLGFEPEQRKFAAHLTLARFKVPQKLTDPLPDLSLPQRAFSVSELVFYRSHLSPKGARYEALERFPLGA